MDFLRKKESVIVSGLGEASVIIGYSPCKRKLCENKGSCSDRLTVEDETRIIDTSKLIFTSQRVVHAVNCKCRDGFVGERCEKKQDPCSPNPCHVVKIQSDSLTIFFLKAFFC